MIGLRKFGVSGHATVVGGFSVGQLHRPCQIHQTQLSREAGQTMSEYAVMLGVIAVGLVLALGVLSGSISNLINRATSLIPT